MNLILDKLLKHAETAARIVGGIDDVTAGIDGVTVGPLADAIDLIARELHGLAKLLASPERTALVDVLAHASSAARLVGHLDDAIAVGPLADHVDTIVHELSELLGEPHPIAAPVPIARPTFALDVTPDAVPEHVALDAPTASRTISITTKDGTRHDLVRLPDPDELGIAFADDETTQPHIALSGGAR